MNPLSSAAMRLLHDAATLGDGPSRLYRAWEAGEIIDEDLAEVIPPIWTNTDDAEQTIGTDAWLAMFRAAGQLVVPTNLEFPSEPLTIFRGTAEARKHGMAWSWDIGKARHFQQRCKQFGEDAHVYRAVVEPGGVLAVFDTRQEHEVVVDPAVLRDVVKIE